jgi:hypothetical protein
MQHKADMFSMGCVLYELLTDQRAFGRPEDEDLAPDQLRQRVLLRHAAWVSSHPAACLVCHSFSTTSILSISVSKKLGFKPELLAALLSTSLAAHYCENLTCLNSCLKVNSFAASPVLDLDLNLITCHGRAFTHAACKYAFSWGMPVVPLRNLCLSFSQCAAV